jgi:hypothetical protein
MRKRGLDHFQGKAAGQEGYGFLAITEGEVNFLWSFIQGSLMNLDTWGRLLDGYGFCQRHAWVHLSVEMAFREQYLLGPTILYAALIEKALHAVSITPRVSRYFLEQKLRPGDACLLCALNIADSSPGASPRPRLCQGRDTRSLLTFASGLERFWSDYVCDLCKKEDCNKNKSELSLCRRHLITEMRARRSVDLSLQRSTLHDLRDRVIRYQESFSAERPTASEQDRAALIAAVGWCSGWRPLLDLFVQARPNVAHEVSADPRD